MWLKSTQSTSIRSASTGLLLRIATFTRAFAIVLPASQCEEDIMVWLKRAMVVLFTSRKVCVHEASAQPVPVTVVPYGGDEKDLLVPECKERFAVYKSGEVIDAPGKDKDWSIAYIPTCMAGEPLQGLDPFSVSHWDAYMHVCFAVFQDLVGHGPTCVSSWLPRSYLRTCCLHRTSCREWLRSGMQDSGIDMRGRRAMRSHKFASCYEASARGARDAEPVFCPGQPSSSLQHPT